MMSMMLMSHDDDDDDDDDANLREYTYVPHGSGIVYITIGAVLGLFGTVWGCLGVG